VTVLDVVKLVTAFWRSPCKDSAQRSQSGNSDSDAEGAAGFRTLLKYG